MSSDHDAIMEMFPNFEMKKDWAEDVERRHLRYSDFSCSCHISGPCLKCENNPSKEEVEAANKFMSDSKNTGGRLK